MAKWKDNKTVGIIAGIVFIIAVAAVILSIVRTSARRDKALLRDNPPAIIE